MPLIMLVEPQARVTICFVRAPPPRSVATISEGLKIVASVFFIVSLLVTSPGTHPSQTFLGTGRRDIFETEKALVARLFHRHRECVEIDDARPRLMPPRMV